MSDHDFEAPSDLFSGSVTRRQLLRRAVFGGIVLAAPPLLKTYGGALEPSAYAADPATLTWALSGPLRSFDPAKSADHWSSEILSLVYDTLLTYDAHGRLVPLLASKYTQTGPTTHVFTIRSNAKFWDGTPVTADDVVFSLSRNLDPKLASELGSFYTNVKSVKKTSANTVTVHLKAPDNSFKYTVPIYSGILSKAFVTAKGAGYGGVFGSIGASTVLGSGPYQPSSFQADQGVTLQLHSGYLGTRPSFQTINAKFVTDPSTLQLALQAGEVDGTFDVPISSASAWSKLSGVTVQGVTGGTIDFLGFNLKQKPWNDVHVRRAFAHSIDKAGLVKSVFHGYAVPANTVPPPALWGSTVPAAELKKIYAGLQSYPFNMNLARSELKRSSVPNGFSATISYPAAHSSLEQALLNLAQNLKGINVHLTVKEIPTTQWLNTFWGHKANVGPQVMEWSPDYLGPGDYPSYFYPSSRAKVNDTNFANYKNAGVDAAVSTIVTNPNFAAQKAAIIKVMKQAAVDVPYLPFWWLDTLVAYRKPLMYTGLSGVFSVQRWVNNLHS